MRLQIELTFFCQKPKQIFSLTENQK